MRHGKKLKKLSKPTDQRLAMLRAIVRSLFLNERVEVTLTRAKAARIMAEKVIATTKTNDLHSRRKAMKVLADGKLVSRIFKTFPERFEGRAGGFTRIIRSGFRRGDSAPLAVLELL